MENWKVYKTSRYRKQTNIYEVSDEGNLRINGKLIDLSYQDCYASSYYRVAGFYIHRAVAELFIPNPENKTHIDHIDGNTHNNNKNNLQWVTHKENLNRPLAKQHFKEHNSRWMQDKHHKDETKQKLKNYNTGSRHMNNGIEGKYVPKDKINYYLNIGYTFGTLKT